MRTPPLLAAAAWVAPALLLLFSAPVSLAREGAIEINQTCATLSGCFPGDTAGFPVQITGAAGRNYRLASDLVVTSAITTAIELSGTTAGYTIDLNGFSLRGPVTCSGAPLVCSTSGLGVGITRLFGSSASGVTIRNGTISGFGSDGVGLSTTDESVLENVVVRENAAAGVRLGTASRVSGVAAVLNFGDGIVVGAGSLIESSTARENGGRGMSSSEGSVIAESAALSNVGTGIESPSAGVTMARNQSRLNGLYGLKGGFATLFIDNAASSNGAVSASAGIFGGSGSRIQSDVLRKNTGLGLDFTGDCAYSNNTITENTVDQVGPATGARGGNECSGPGTGVATCP